MKSEIFLNKFNILRSQVSAWLRDSSTKQPLLELGESTRYMLDAPGKRLRPVLSLVVGEMLGIPQGLLKPFAIALECIHCSSLIHDDLPALDDDNERRGKPTCHRVFGEGIAILAGDALVAEAFRTVVNAKEIPDTIKVKLVSLLSSAFLELCEGQALELQDFNLGSLITIGQDENASKEISSKEFELVKAEIRKRHIKKTGALISAAVAGPALFLQPPDNDRVFVVLRSFGLELGLLFQITDDLIDAQDELSHDVKKTGVVNTYVTVFGANEALRQARETAEQAIALLKDLDYDASILRSLCFYVLERKN